MVTCLPPRVADIPRSSTCISPSFLQILSHTIMFAGGAGMLVLGLLAGLLLGHEAFVFHSIVFAAIGALAVLIAGFVLALVVENIVDNDHLHERYTRLAATQGIHGLIRSLAQEGHNPASLLRSAQADGFSLEHGRKVGVGGPVFADVSIPGHTRRVAVLHPGQMPAFHRLCFAFDRPLHAHVRALSAHESVAFLAAVRPPPEGGIPCFPTSPSTARAGL